MNTFSLKTLEIYIKKYNNNILLIARLLVGITATTKMVSSYLSRQCLTGASRKRTFSGLLRMNKMMKRMTRR